MPLVGYCRDIDQAVSALLGQEWSADEQLWRVFVRATWLDGLRSKRPLSYWILATFLLCLACSSRRIARELGIHIRTSYRWCWWLRPACLIAAIPAGISWREQIQPAGVRWVHSINLSCHTCPYPSADPSANSAITVSSTSFYGCCTPGCSAVFTRTQR
jgi:hypothetical protein